MIGRTVPGDMVVVLPTVRLLIATLAAFRQWARGGTVVADGPVELPR